MKAGDTLPILGGLTVLATPGHTPDHLSFYSPTTGALFVGDALNTRKDTLNLTPKKITHDLEKARRSGRQLLGLTPALFACGHGTPLQNHDAGDLMRLQLSLKASETVDY